MDMRIDATLIKKLRDERAWSQEHLAAVTGLSLRTIQRVEAEGNASPETRLALAAAFAIDVAQLVAVGVEADATSAAPPQAATASADPATDRWWRPLPYRLICFLLIAGLPAVFEVSQHGTITWSKWPLLLCGVWLAFRWIRQRYDPTAPGPATAPSLRRPLAYVAAEYAVIGAFLALVDIFKHHAITWSKWPVLSLGLVVFLRWAKERYGQPALARSDTGGDAR